MRISAFKGPLPRHWLRRRLPLRGIELKTERKQASTLGGCLFKEIIFVDCLVLRVGWRGGR